MRLRVRTNGDAKGWGIDGCQAHRSIDVEGGHVHEHTYSKARRSASRLVRSTVAVVAAVVGLLAVSTPPAYAEDPLDLVRDLVDDELVEPRNTGGGDSMGAMTYVGTALPKVLALCEPGLTFKLGDGIDPPPGVKDDGWDSQAFVFNTVISGYAGPVKMTGGGHSDTSCESYSLGGGVMTVALEGYNELTESRLDCRDNYPNQDPVAKEKSSSLRGRYTRVLSDMTVILTGRCLVNDFATGQVTFVARLQAVPGDTEGLEGVKTSVRTLTTTGAFVLAPS